MALKVKVENKLRESWWQSRRMWGAILSGVVAITAVLFPDFADKIVVAGTGIASVLGINSYLFPKR